MFLVLKIKLLCLGSLENVSFCVRACEASLLGNPEETTLTGWTGGEGSRHSCLALTCGMRTYMSLGVCPVITRSNVL